MNKDNALQYLPLIHALADGKTIQHRYGDMSWRDKNDSIGFGSSPENYRIKPAGPKVIYVSTYPDGSGISYTEAQVAKIPAITKSKIELVKYVEVIDEESK